MKITEASRKFIKKECEKPTALFKGCFKTHIVLAVKNALKLAEKRKADKEIVEVATWLHDVGSVSGDPANHHISGAKMAEKFLSNLNYPKEKIEKVKHCIFSHRASQKIKRETKEAQIVADADALAHYDDINGLLKRLFKGNKKNVLAKLERSYLKLSPDAKLLVKSKLEKARKDLR